MPSDLVGLCQGVWMSIRDVSLERCIGRHLLQRGTSVCVPQQGFRPKYDKLCSRVNSINYEDPSVIHTGFRKSLWIWRRRTWNLRGFQKTYDSAGKSTDVIGWGPMMGSVKFTNVQATVGGTCVGYTICILQSWCCLSSFSGVGYTRGWSSQSWRKRSNRPLECSGPCPSYP